MQDNWHMVAELSSEMIYRPMQVTGAEAALKAGMAKASELESRIADTPAEAERPGKEAKSLRHEALLLIQRHMYKSAMQASLL